MATTKFDIAQVIEDGEEQIIVFPQSFHLPGKEVTIRRVSRGVLIEPKVSSALEGRKGSTGRGGNKG